MRIGLDIGSTTIKCVVLDDEEQLVFTAYERHYSHIVDKTREMLKRVMHDINGAGEAYLALSGSAGMGLAQSCQIPFVQEVYATRVAASRLSPDADTVIELGGEDAKILFLTGGVEVRMNGTCAGGTGAFIDQMATLLKMEADELDREALKAERIYPIASRCGVFAKSDIQPLINQGAAASDIAASIYQAVVNQTIGGLAQGRPIRGNILYLGGPLTFSACLRQSFDRTLKVKGVNPEHALYYVALGAAYYADRIIDLEEVIRAVERYGSASVYAGLPALFETREDYWKFHNRHMKASVARVRYEECRGSVHIGIDSGSTTIKMAVIDEEGRLLHTWYETNEGNPVPLLKKELIHVYDMFPGVQIASVTATGYGEDLIRHAFRCDHGVVETVAHFTAAKNFLPDVDFIIDIGGQDMKCFRIEDGAIADIFLNEACSSGCGSFLQTFAEALGYDVQEFARIGIYARRPVDLGSRCTVFMNSSIKQAQKDGAGIEDISAGLSVSVVKNALYKVIRCSGPEELGRRIVVQGGTFYNEAVLRAFEMEMGTEVIRPDIAGLMGAYGAALYGKKKTPADSRSSLLSREELETFTQKMTTVNCGLCGNHCLLTVSTFSDGKRYISGNRCERPVTGRKADDSLNLCAYKRELLETYMHDAEPGKRGTVGIPLVLNMYELLPFWYAVFKKLGMQVKVSPFSDHAMFLAGQESIPSDTVCYPAKLSHGHIRCLLDSGVSTIFYPCMTYNLDEGLGDNHYNCPIVAYYPEVLAGNCRGLEDITFIKEYFSLSDPARFEKKFAEIMKKYFPDITAKEFRDAAKAGYAEYAKHMGMIRSRAQQIIAEAEKQGRHIIVLAGRPYHVDPEISHGIDQLIMRQGAAVITEDSVSNLQEKFPVAVLNQWTYHSRLYAAAKYCIGRKDMDLVQLVSFGCGLDAITTDETRDILRAGNKLYTQLKIDEITNLGTVNIRIRSLFAALEDQ